MRKIHIIMLSAGLLGASTAWAQPNPMTPQQFVTNASVGNMFEVESSKLAMQRAQENETKDLAQELISDHSKAGEQLKAALDDSKSGARPAAALDAKHQALMDNLKQAPSNSFDERYLTIQKSAHNEAINLFSDYASQGTDTALKKFAVQTLPTLQKHQNHVHQLKAE